MRPPFKVLISDPLSAEAEETLRASGHIEVIREEKNFDAHLAEIDGWIIRSGTKITGDHLERAKRLSCICRAGVGVDNIDLDAATRHGVVVMNTPDANSMAAAEHTVALLLALARNIPFAHLDLARGGWNRQAFVGVEVEGKRAGIIGLGKIGRIVGRKLRGLGMKVAGVDPFVSAELARDLGIELTTIDELLPNVDFLTVHVPLTAETRGLIGEDQLARARRELRIINCSRGGVIDEAAALKALASGQLAGLALDVFATEPLPKDSPLRNHPKIVTTPHLGASTVEAQEQVALESAALMRDYLLTGTVLNAVNAPSLGGEQRQRYTALLSLAGRLGSLHAQIIEGQPQTLALVLEERLIKEGIDRHLVGQALVGFLQGASATAINAVNARMLAAARGINVSVRGRTRGEVYSNSIVLEVGGTAGTRTLEGAVIWEDSLRLVRFDKYSVEGALEGPLLITASRDRPGMIGDLGKFLGERGYNIANMSLGRDAKGGNALAIFNLDELPRAEDVKALTSLPGVTWARSIRPA